MIISDNVKSNLKKVSFKGMEPARSASGQDAFDFFLPYDDKKYKKVEIELVPLKYEGTSFVVDQDYREKPPVSIPLKDGKATFNPSKHFGGDQPFAYRFKLTDANDENKFVYHTDSGLRTEDKDSKTAKFNVVLRNRAPVTNPGGTIIHLMPDNHNVGWYHDKITGELKEDPAARARAMEGKRNHFSTYGGNIAGIIQDIPRMHKMGYDFVLATPLFGGDEISNHGYWTTNPYQMTKKNGTLNDFKKLNVALYKKDMGLIADGAFVNEGMEGYRFKHVQKWGKKSPYWYNFRMSGNPTIKNLPNLDPNSTKGKEVYSHIKIHVVNGNKKYTCTDKGIESAKQARDPKKLTYFQLYDDRLLSEQQKEQIKKGELIDPSLSKHTTGNHYEITNDNHSVMLRTFEVSEDEISEFENRIESNKDLYSSNKKAFLETALTFRNFNISSQADNFEAWDGNADIAKLRYGYSMKDEENFSLQGLSLEEKRKYQQGGFQNQDHIQKVAIFWTQTAKNSMVEDAARAMKNANGAEGYKALFADPKDALPSRVFDVMEPAVVDNVLSGKYKIPQLKTTSNLQDRLQEDLMNLPLESIEFSPDVTAVLGSPFISKKAITKEDVTKTRYEFYKDKAHLDRVPKECASVYSEADDFYANTLTSFAADVVKKADTEGKFVDKEGKLTDAGKLALPMVAHDVLKFAVVKALAPDMKVENKNGELIYGGRYDGKSLGDINLKNIGGTGITSNSPEDEAKKVVTMMKKGVAGISDADKKILADSIKQRFEGVKASDLKMAYVLVDRTSSGLNWRTDATKDTAPIGEVKDGWENFGAVMDEAKDFWQGFTESIKKVNPNAYIIGEMTDVRGLMDETKAMGGDGAQPGAGRHDNVLGFESNFVNETGITGLSNYTYFFSSILGTVSTWSDNGKKAENLNNVKAKIQEGRLDSWDINKGFIFQYAQDGVKTSHNFAANHDKPRLLSILALDNQLFHWNFAEKELESSISKKSEDFSKREKALADYEKKFKEKETATEEDKKRLNEGKAKLEKDKKDFEEVKKSFESKKAKYEKAKATYTPNIAKAGLTPNCKALAMAKALDESMSKTVDGMVGLGDKAETKKKLTDAIKDLAQGDFKGKKFDPEAFGVSPIDFAIKDVLAQAKEKHGLKLSEAQEKKLNDDIFEAILAPALEKMLFVDKIFALLPGRNTSYSGDEYLATGYEAPCKNLYQQNRNVAHREWVDDAAKHPEKQFMRDYYEQKRKINAARRDKELSALAKGETIALNTPEGSVLAMFRYDKVSELICLAHSKNIVSHNEYESFSFDKTEDCAKKCVVDEIDLSGYQVEGYKKFDLDNMEDKDKFRYTPQKEGTIAAGLAGGLAIGTYFLNGIDKAAKTVYGVCEKAGKHVVKQFKDKDEYEKYLKAGKDFAFTDAHKIKLTDNMMVLRKAGRVAFHGNQKHNANYIKIQSYLNSKANLSTKQKAVI